MVSHPGSSSGTAYIKGHDWCLSRDLHKRRSFAAGQCGAQKENRQRSCQELSEFQVSRTDCSLSEAPGPKSGDRNMAEEPVLESMESGGGANQEAPGYGAIP